MLQAPVDSLRPVSGHKVDIQPVALGVLLSQSLDGMFGRTFKYLSQRHVDHVDL